MITYKDEVTVHIDWHFAGNDLVGKCGIYDLEVSKGVLRIWVDGHSYPTFRSDDGLTKVKARKRAVAVLTRRIQKGSK